LHLFVGAGAVGIGLGATLLAAGESVGFVARGATARALSRDGCARTGLFGDASFPPSAFRVLETPAAFGALDAALDAVWVATKSWASADVARELSASAAVRESDAPIVLAQNGLGNAEIFAERFSSRRVCNASVITGFQRRAPSRVEVTVHADPILLGSLFGAGLDALRPLAAALSRGGIPANVTSDFGAVLWAKVLYNCALNPLGALLGVPYGELGRGERTRELMGCVAHEVYAVMRATGEHTHWPDADSWIRHFHESLLPATERHESSMLQDVRAGRRTEIDALCGEIARRGARQGIATPVNRALAVLVRALEVGGADRR
jgi:2-dehydropantoate 2-reductase